MKKFRQFMLVVILTAATIVAMNRATLAIQIDFAGIGGGAISYAGGINPINGSGLNINSVSIIPPGPSSTVGVTGGSMNFTTGNYVSSMSFGGNTYNLFGSGGSLVISGTILSFGINSVSTLMQATFNPGPTFQYSGTSPINGSIAGNLNVGFINPILAAAYGLSPSPTTGYGTMNLFLTYNGGTLLSGGAFSASQNSSNLVATVNAVSAPASLLLLGSGLTVLGLVGLRRSRCEGADSTQASFRSV